MYNEEGNIISYLSQKLNKPYNVLKQLINVPALYNA